MEVQVHHLEILIDQVFEKANLPVHTKAFAQVADLIGEEISRKYLYESIFLRIKEAKKEKAEIIKLQDDKLNVIAKFLDHKTFRGFIEKIENPIDPVLDALVGNYYSYVRRNDDKGIIFRSPVSVLKEKGKFWLELTGPMWKFKGEIKLRHGCLFVLLDSQGGKMIHHIYKIGNRQKPKVLQGIFSGVSTNFDPIGGRVVLVRMDGDITKLTNAESPIKEFLKSPIKDERAVVKYLKEYSENNLKIGRVVTFGVDDLLS